MIAPFGGHVPQIHPTAYVPEQAVVIGDVVIGPQSSLWFHTVVRGDIHPIRIGARSNVQDNTTIHVVGGRFATIIGDGVTIGHNAVVHGCTLGDGCLVGMGAIVMDGAEIGAESLVGAGALVTPGTIVPPRSLVLGSPAKRVRDVNDEELGRLRNAAENYVELVRQYRGPV
ncbi:MAG TPA: gamma carbonic anhydrase family protein [Candidatus Binatia bacterium]|jgi:carbonic anhydrase/acetyltransferase-like protein (isoleucine patch superfamily)|nr:gamma carbonic anhydrase family protein [Candidatus Binatia bacterium]